MTLQTPGSPWRSRRKTPGHVHLHPDVCSAKNFILVLSFFWCFCHEITGWSVNIFCNMHVLTHNYISWWTCLRVTVVQEATRGTSVTTSELHACGHADRHTASYFVENWLQSFKGRCHNQRNQNSFTTPVSVGMSQSIAPKWIKSHVPKFKTTTCLTCSFIFARSSTARCAAPTPSSAPKNEEELGWTLHLRRHLPSPDAGSDSQASKLISEL